MGKAAGKGACCWFCFLQVSDARFCVSYRSESEQVEDAEATAAAQKRADEEAKEKVCPFSTAN